MPIIHARLEVILFLSGRVLLFKVINHGPTSDSQVVFSVCKCHLNIVAVFNNMF